MNLKKLLVFTYNTILLIVTLIVVGYYFLVLRNPLPSDEEMIAFFQAHRADIEELVSRYRIFNPDLKVDHSTGWRKGLETQRLLKRAMVDDISFSAYSPWLPSPYSIETAKSLTEQSRKAKDYRVFIKYGGLTVRLLPWQYYRSINLKYFNIWKDFYFIPEVPRIENGELLWPVNANGEYSARRRVLSSLNDFPDTWKDFECVFRRIDTHWFLSMCNGH